MRGGDVFMESLATHGVRYVFGNPGSTENSLLDRLIDFPELSYVTALHEGVAVGAATFYALATGKTGVVNLHIAPGLGNAIGMMFGTFKANAPVIITAGQRDTRMRLRRTLLSHDLVGMAAPVTKWSVEPRSGDEVAPIMQKAFEIANEPPCGPVFVSLPVDVMEEETECGALKAAQPPFAGYPDQHDVERLVDLLISAQRPAIVAGDDIGARDAVAKLVRLSEQTASCVFRESLHSHISFPTNHQNFRGHTPLDAETMRKVFSEFDVVFLIGGQFFEEMWFNEGHPIPETAATARLEETAGRLSSTFPIETRVLADIPETLDRISERLAERISTKDQKRIDSRNLEYEQANDTLRQGVRSGIMDLPDTLPMSSTRAVYEIVQALSDDAVIIDESLTASLLDISSSDTAIASGAIYTAFELTYDLEDRGDFFGGRGGGLGQAMSGAIGLQMAYPDRPVVALIGDGSAMYSIQALWTAAHYDLPILFIIFANREYRVLKHNLDIYRHRFGVGGNRPYPHMDLSNPKLSYHDIAGGLGVQGELVSEPEALAEAVRRALADKKPRLIEIEVAGKM